MSTTLSCPSWTQNSQNQSPCEMVQQVDRVCTYTYNIVVSSPVEGDFIPYGSNVTACTCSWASYNLLSACMFCVSSSPSLVSWNEWTTNCPANLTSTTTYLPSYAGTSLASNTSIPCYAGYDPRNWQNGQFNEQAASSFPTGVNLNLTGTTSSCDASSSSRKTPVGAIVGGVLGGVFVLLLFCGCVVFAIHRRRRRTLKSSPEITGPTSDTTTDASASIHLDIPAEKHPVAIVAPIQVVDHAHTTVVPLISDSHYRLRAQGVGAGLPSQGVSTIARAPEQVHKSYCPLAPPARVVVPQEHDFERPPAPPARVVVLQEHDFERPPAPPARVVVLQEHDFERPPAPPARVVVPQKHDFERPLSAVPVIKWTDTQHSSDEVDPSPKEGVIERPPQSLTPATPPDQTCDPRMRHLVEEPVIPSKYCWDSST